MGATLSFIPILHLIVSRELINHHVLMKNITNYNLKLQLWRKTIQVEAIKQQKTKDTYKIFGI